MMWILCLFLQCDEVPYKSTVRDGVLVSVEFDVTKAGVEGPHLKHRHWRDCPNVTLKVADYRGTPWEKSHACPVSFVSKEEGDKTNCTCNCWPGTLKTNRVRIRRAELFIESIAPAHVKITAQYDGKGPHLKGVEVPDAFLYEITNDDMECRFFIPNKE